MKNITAYRPDTTDSRKMLWVISTVAVGVLVVKGLYEKLVFLINSDVPTDQLLKGFSFGDIFFTFVAAVLALGSYFLTGYILKKRMPEQKVVLRYSLQFFLTAALVASLVSIQLYVYYTVIYDYEAPSIFNFINSAMNAFVVPLILMALLETFHYRGAWLREQYLREKQQKEAVVARFEALSNQLSPHFIFNSFNILGGLIEEDKEEAGKFLNELSQVYRYILDHKDSETVLLGEELDSLQAFLDIQEARHPGTICFDLKVSQENRKRPIIPMTLHTLVENIFKHNRLSVRNPIQVKIYLAKNDTLVVENSLQKKLNVEKHNIGLANLSRRYEMLVKRGLNITQTPTLFRVEVPACHKEQPA